MDDIAQKRANERLCEGAILGDVADVQSALAAGAQIDSRDGYDATPLHWAVASRNPTLVRLLLDRGAGLQARDCYLNTPLHWAVAEGDIAIVGLLSERGSTLTARNRSEETPTALAARLGRTEVVDLLERDAAKQQGHAGRIDDERKDKGPRQPGG